jgi:LAO/AO transport system kinase
VDVVLVETVGVGQTELDVMRLADSIVVVLVPEAGDTVQVMKAGLLEIADVFVVNKADREGADRMVGELERMLHMLPAQGAWEVPVLATKANQDVGIAELLAAIRTHRDHRRAHSESEHARQGRRREVYDIAEEELAARLRQAMNDGEFEDVLSRVDRQEMDPYGAAGEVLEDRQRLEAILSSVRGG